VAGLVIKPRARIFHGHEWVYASDVQKTFGDPEPGSVVSLKDFKDRALGSAIYNPKSQIVARRFSRRKQALDAEFFQRRIARALEYRRRLVAEGAIAADLHRLVWSESDGLPGVVIDRYGGHIVLQTLTLGMDQRKGLIVDALKAALAPSSIIERNDAPVRAAEGLPLITGVLDGVAPSPFRIETPSGLFVIDFSGGQKTGLYLDQFGNYAIVARRSGGRRVLDCFCNQGGFALACVLGGAASVTGVDSSAAAVALARENAVESGVAGRTTFVEANVFDYLNAVEKDVPSSSEESTGFDHIILDPPSFARSRSALADARRGYKEIHLRALKLLRPGGFLSTFSCSHHVTRDEFLSVIIEAATDARRTLRLASILTQNADHPIVPAIPESEYLKGFTFEIMAGW